MKALIKEVDDNKKLIDYRLIDGTEDLEYFAANGYTDEEDVEQAENGDWYLAGYVPEPLVEEMQSKVRAIRDTYLQHYDFTQLPDAPFTEEEKAKYADYRQYLRDYTTLPNWWEQNPMTFEEWSDDEVA